MGEEGLASGVYGFEQPPVLVVRSPIAEADERQRDGSSHFEPVVSLKPASELPSPGRVVADEGRRSLASQVPHYEPELQRTEAPTER